MLTTHSGRKPSQNFTELVQFIGLLRERKVRRYCEIGARHGDTFHKIMTSLPAGAYGLAVDMPGGLWGAKGTGSQLSAACADLGRLGYSTDIVIGDSQSQEAEDAIYAMGPFDAVLIDADHTYDGVRTDWMRYSNLAPIVAFHDIVGAGEAENVTGRPVEVPRLWAEIRGGGLATVEFIAPGSRMGIGCVFPREGLSA